MTRLAMLAALALLTAQPAGAQLMNRCQSLDGWAFRDCLSDTRRERDRQRELDQLRDRQDELDRQRLYEGNAERARAPLFGNDLWPQR